MTLFQGKMSTDGNNYYIIKGKVISVIREYIEIFYNRQRRHSRLGNISPAAFREKYHQMAA
ncbi:transposase [Shigella sonnei]|nr:transposase [Shigella sonnei]